MTAPNAADTQTFVDAYEERGKVDAPEWLASYQEESIKLFRSAGLPLPGNEEWKYTNLAGLRKREFALASAQPQQIASDALSELLICDPDGFLAVFVNGVFSEEHSRLPEAGSGFEVEPLSAAIARGVTGLEELVTSGKDFGFGSFADLNSALFHSGACIHVAWGVEIKEPLYLLHINDSPDGSLMVHPRNVVCLEEGARLSLIEDYIGLGGSAYLSNPFTHFQLADNAGAVHYRLVREGEGSFHISNLGVRQGNHSSFASHSFCFSGGVVRNDVAAFLEGEGIECTLNGLTVGRDEEHVDNHTRIIHSRPNCNSWEMYKAVLAEKAHGVFNGKIYVAQDAQKTDAKQSNQALLLSDTAVMDSKPELEIYADDVKCTHGATVGQLNEDGLFYLRSRGVGREAARVLLVYAFASDLVSEIEHPGLKAWVEALLFEKLPGDCEPAGVAIGAA
ncbi:MAG: Fe-S cluster assembly protein SufD [Planctomycetota bacterium]|nr:Fe-S cluster assembly protein SufD [Planctomycetota bacterium]